MLIPIKPTPPRKLCYDGACHSSIFATIIPNKHLVTPDETLPRPCVEAGDSTVLAHVGDLPEVHFQ